MKNYLFIIAAISAALTNPRQAESQSFEWVKGQSHAISINPDFAGFPSTADNTGNSLLALIEDYKLNWSQELLGNYSIKKFDPYGALLFDKTLTGRLNISDIRTDLNNNIYILCSFMDTLMIDSVNYIFNTGSGFNLNYCIIKLDSNGNFVWKKNISAEYSSNYAVKSFTLKGNNLYVCLTSVYQHYLKKFDVNGNEMLSVSINSTNTFSNSSIDIDFQGNIILGGACGSGALNIGGLIANTSHIYNIFFAKISPQGSGIWVKFVEDITFQKVNVVCDKNGNIFAAGDLWGSFMFGNIQAQGRQWVFDFFLTKIDPSGNFIWLREVPETQSITGDARKGKYDCIALDEFNNVYLTGFQRGSMNWGNGIMTTSSGSSDALILKYDPNGNLMFGKTAGGPGGDRVDEISVDNSGKIFLSGNFGNTALFDTLALTGFGNINSFIVKMTDGTNPGKIAISVVMEGFYDASLNTMRLNDTLRVYLRNSMSPFAVIDSAVALSDSLIFKSEFRIPNAQSGSYYLQLKHRNSIETWSSNPINFVRGGNINYNFTDSKTKAYGENLVQVDNSPVLYGIYSGDTDQDEVIDLSDLVFIFNAAGNFLTGYTSSDVNGDGITDLTDLLIAYNNASMFVGLIRP